ncbi:MAG: ATP synthase F1 subunit delta [Patescibacteria group bacterium]
MKNTDKIFAEALYEILETSHNMESAISDFLTFLKKKARLHRIEKIIKEFEKIYNAKNGIASLKIKSAHKLDTKVVHEIAGALGIKDYELQSEVDKDLLGGFVAQYGDNLIDASFKNNLNKLHQQLKS